VCRPDAETKGSLASHAPYSRLEKSKHFYVLTDFPPPLTTPPLTPHKIKSKNNTHTNHKQHIHSLLIHEFSTLNYKWSTHNAYVSDVTVCEEGPSPFLLTSKDRKTHHPKKAQLTNNTRRSEGINT